MDVVLQVRTRPPITSKGISNNRIWRGTEQGELDTEHLTNQDMSRLLKQAQWSSNSKCTDAVQRAYVSEQEERYPCLWP